MIGIKTFSLENINRVKDKYHSDPSLIEKNIYAFKLLDLLVQEGTSFIFKGGTSLMLILDEPKRISIDIDIVVEPAVGV